MSRFIRILSLAVIALACTLAAFAAKVVNAADHTFTVVIDAGHGGKDHGCVGHNTSEKDVNLHVAKLLGDKISDCYADEVKVVLTRSTDEFISLQNRAKIANDAHGDLFISIHVNSVDKKSKNRNTVAGASVYTCGLHRSESNLQVAMRENSVMELEPDYTTTYQGFDPNSSESYIIFELSQNMHQQQSISFATLAQNALIQHAGRADMGVRQAGFWVLWATSMPSVLVELDFMCNPDQERFLSSAEGKDKCAQALFQAFATYYDTKTASNN